MSYAYVAGGVIGEERGTLPDSARRLDNQQWVMGLSTAPANLLQTTGWKQVTDTARPADTATDTYDRTLTLVGGVPTVTWVQRPKTQGELDVAMASANNATIQTEIANARATNNTTLDQLATGLTVLTSIKNNCDAVIDAPVTNLATAATALDSLAAEVKRLANLVQSGFDQTAAATRQLNKLGRLILGQLDDVS